MSRNPYSRHHIWFQKKNYDKGARKKLREHELCIVPKLDQHAHNALHNDLREVDNATLRYRTAIGCLAVADYFADKGHKPIHKDLMLDRIMIWSEIANITDPSVAHMLRRQYEFIGDGWLD